nr:hypothetical protein [Actinomadura sp. NBRC 104425]
MPHRDRTGLNVQIHPAKGRNLAPSQACEGCQQHHGAQVFGHQVGQLEDLCHREHRPFVRLLFTGTADPARVARDDQVVGRRHEDRTQEPVRLRRIGGPYPCFDQRRAPLPDARRVDLPQLHIAEIRRDVVPQQPRVDVDRPGPQVRPLCDPLRCVVLEVDLGALGVGPLARDQLCFDERKLLVGLAFGGEGAASRVNGAVGARIPDLKPP